MALSTDMLSTFIKLAESDLKAASILYASRQYRTSFYLFQQASEKASKVIVAIFTNVGTEKQFRTMGHGMDRQHIKDIKSEHERLKKTIIAIKDSKLKNLSFVDVLIEYEAFLGAADVDKIVTSINYEMVNVLKLIRKIRSDGKLPISEDEIKTYIVDMQSDISTLMKHEEQISLELMIEFFKVYMPLVLQIGIASSIIALCTFITAPHHNKTRYPVGGNDPLSIYNLRFPAIRHQEELMKHLGFAIRTFKKYYAQQKAS